MSNELGVEKQAETYAALTGQVSWNSPRAVSTEPDQALDLDW